MWGSAVINPESIFFKVLIFQNICKRYSKITAVSYWVQVPFCAKPKELFVKSTFQFSAQVKKRQKYAEKSLNICSLCNSFFYINTKATTEELFRLIDGDLRLNNAQGCMNRQQMSLWLVTSGTASSEKHQFLSPFAFMPTSANHGIKYKWKPTFIKGASLANTCSSAGVLN